MKTLELIIVSILAVISAMVAFDFTVYTVKSSPKASSLSKRLWKLGMVCMIVLVYYIINGFKFF